MKRLKYPALLAALILAGETSPKHSGFELVNSAGVPTQSISECWGLTQPSERGGLTPRVVRSLPASALQDPARQAGPGSRRCQATAVQTGSVTQQPVLTLAQATNISEENAGRDNDAAPAASEPDNSGKNERDRSGEFLTPFDQGKSKADVDLTRRIRRAITNNDQLSTNAKNIKIITVDGKVTLRGPVNSQEEQKTIASIVQGLGVTSVDDQLEVKEQK